MEAEIGIGGSGENGTGERREVRLCDEFTMLLREMGRGEEELGVEYEAELAEKKQERIEREKELSEGAKTKKRKVAKKKKPEGVNPQAFFMGAVATAGGGVFEDWGGQQDAQEFLRCVLDRMRRELASEARADGVVVGLQDLDDGESVVEKTFRGTMWNKIECLGCGEYTIKPDPFLDVALVIPRPMTSPPIATATKKIENKGKKAEDGDETLAPSSLPPITLSDCLTFFSNPEPLDYPSSPCQSCTSDVGFARGSRFGELPKVLCIQLKRFQYEEIRCGRGKRRLGKKVDVMVQFPELLEMGQYLEGDMGGGEVWYGLYAVVVHEGKSLGSGHYVAYVKTEEEDWWQLNDEKAVKVDVERVLGCKAYLLFYQQVET